MVRRTVFGDHMLSLTAGFSFHIGRVGWKRAIDPSPYIRRDQWLVERVKCFVGRTVFMQGGMTETDGHSLS